MTEEFPTSGPHAEVLRILDHSVRCSICYSLYDAPLALRACGHSFCSGCIRQNLDFQEKSGQPHCPSCRAACDARDLQPNVSLREVVDRYAAARKSILFLLQDAEKSTKELNNAQHVKEEVEEKQERTAAGHRRVHGQRRREIATNTNTNQQHVEHKAGGSRDAPQRRISRRSVAGKEEHARKAAAAGEPSPVGHGPQGPRTRRRASGGDDAKEGGSDPVTGRIQKSTATTSTAAAAAAAGTGGGAGALETSDSDFCIEILSSDGDGDDDGDGDGDEDHSSDPEFTGLEEEKSPSPPAAKKAKRQRTSSEPQHKVKAGRGGSQNPGPLTASDTPSGFVKCPICTKSVPSFYINSHVDQCLLASTNSQAPAQLDMHKGEDSIAARGAPEELEPLAGQLPAAAATHNTNQQQQQQINSGAGPSTEAAPFQPLTVPHKLVATLVSEKQLRAMLKRYDVPSDGKKVELLDRYNRFRLAVETANDRQERTTYARLAQRLVVLDKRKAAASLLGRPHSGSGNGGGARLQTDAPKAVNRTTTGNDTTANNGDGDGLIEMGSSYKQLIAVCRARDAARKAARQVAAVPVTAAGAAEATAAKAAANDGLEIENTSLVVEPINVRNLFHRPAAPENEQHQPRGCESQAMQMQPQPTIDQSNDNDSNDDGDGAEHEHEQEHQQEQAHPNSMPDPLIQPSPASCGRHGGSQEANHHHDKQQHRREVDVAAACDSMLGDSEDEVL